jgi:hypothetical protein
MIQKTLPGIQQITMNKVSSANMRNKRRSLAKRELVVETSSAVKLTVIEAFRGWKAAL